MSDYERQVAFLIGREVAIHCGHTGEELCSGRLLKHFPEAGAAVVWRTGERPGLEVVNLANVVMDWYPPNENPGFHCPFPVIDELSFREFVARWMPERKVLIHIGLCHSPRKFEAVELVEDGIGGIYFKAGSRHRGSLIPWKAIACARESRF